mgnify:CR=1 FL=1
MYVVYVSWRLLEAHLYVFYVSWRLWEAHLYVFYVSGRLRGGTDSKGPKRPGGSAREDLTRAGGGEGKERILISTLRDSDSDPSK